MARSKRNYPYQRSHDIVLTLEEPEDRYDREKIFSWNYIKPGVSDDSSTRLDLRGDEQWFALEMDATARLDLEKLEELLPSGEDPADATCMMVSVQCHKTYLRKTFKLDGPDENGEWRGQITIERRDSLDRVYVEPVLYRKSKVNGSTSEKKAKHQFAIIATSELATVCFIDNLEKSRTAPVRFKWERFQESPNLWRKRHSDTLYHIDTSVEPPTVYINMQEPGPRLKSIMHKADSGSKDTGAALGRITACMLAAQIFVDLFFAAMQDIDGSASEDIDVPSGWQGNLLTQFIAAGLFADDGEEYVTDVRAGLERAHQKLGHPTGIVELHSKVGTIAQKLSGPGMLKEFSKAFQDAAEEGTS